jgi:hypothetical protein
MKPSNFVVSEFGDNQAFLTSNPIGSVLIYHLLSDTFVDSRSLTREKFFYWKAHSFVSLLRKSLFNCQGLESNICRISQEVFRLALKSDMLLPKQQRQRLMTIYHCHLIG